jgi:hypothetical protein
MVLAFGAALLLAGCPGGRGGAGESGPSGECTKLEAQCTLKGGVLGVCSEIACPSGGTPPCLRCMPQH